MNKLSDNEARFIKRWLLIVNDSERDILLRAMKPKENYAYLWWVFAALCFVMMLNYFGLEEFGEKWLR